MAAVWSKCQCSIQNVHEPGPCWWVQQRGSSLPAQTNAIAGWNYSSAGAVCCLAPAPFCCSTRTFGAWKAIAAVREGRARTFSKGSRYKQNNDDQDDFEDIIAFSNKDQEQSVAGNMRALDENRLQIALSNSKAMHVDKHLFLHRWIWDMAHSGFERERERDVWYTSLLHFIKHKNKYMPSSGSEM